MARKNSKVRRAVERRADIEACKRAVTAAKRTVAPFPVPRDRFGTNQTPCPPQTFGVIARMIDTPEGYCPSTFLAKVKVVMTTVPELPDVVTLEGKVFVLVESAPLTYIQRTASEATRV